jgi:hypothetical protein
MAAMGSVARALISRFVHSHGHPKNSSEMLGLAGPKSEGFGLPTRCQALDQHLNSSFEGWQGERFHRTAERA